MDENLTITEALLTFSVVIAFGVVVFSFNLEAFVCRCIIRNFLEKENSLILINENLVII